MTCNTCVYNNTEQCERCVWNYPYLKDYYCKYTITCPFHMVDCIYDPAYAQCYHPNWYKNHWGDISPDFCSPLACRECKEAGMAYNYDNDDQ